MADIAEQIRTLVNLGDDDSYDEQIQAAVDLCKSQSTDELKLYCSLCTLERFAPELVAAVTDYTIGNVSETFNLDGAESFCQVYKRIGEETELASVGNPSLGRAERQGLV